MPGNAPLPPPPLAHRKTLEHCAMVLKNSPPSWRHALARSRLGSNPSQIINVALELVMEALRDALSAVLPLSADRPEASSLLA